MIVSWPVGRHAYIDAFAGISGDMVLGALIDCGLPVERLHRGLSRLDVGEFRIEARAVERHHIGGTQVVLHLPHEHAHRGLSDILGILDGSPLSDRVKEQAGAVFRRIGEAEARVHRIPVEEVHFHEVGAMDSILDVVGAVLGLEMLGVESVSASPLPMGQGTVRAAHGTLPLPSPATLGILEGIPCRPVPVEGETTTPTGAALAAVLVSSFGPMPAGRPSIIGYGAGSRDDETLPNLLRIVLMESEDLGLDSVDEMEANLDDMTGEAIGFLCDRLRERGALDVFLTPVQMKKGRPGTLLAVLARPSDTASLRDILLTHSTTLGVRVSRKSRWVLRRSFETVETPYGQVRVKVAEGRRAAPEYDDCARAAVKHGVTLEDVRTAALRARGAR